MLRRCSIYRQTACVRSTPCADAATGATDVLTVAPVASPSPVAHSKTLHTNLGVAATFLKDAVLMWTTQQPEPCNAIGMAQHAMRGLLLQPLPTDEQRLAQARELRSF